MMLRSAPPKPDYSLDFMSRHTGVFNRQSEEYSKWLAEKRLYDKGVELMNRYFPHADETVLIDRDTLRVTLADIWFDGKED